MFKFAQNKYYNKGFTLVELLVVIAIVGVLASVVLSSLNSARAKSRDAKRLMDLRQLQNALEMYYTDNGSYPYNGSWWGNCSTFGSKGTTGATGYIPNLAPTYISQLPLDPKPIGTTGCYLYQSLSGNDYLLMAYTTVEGTVPDSLKRPSNPGEKDFALYSGAGSTY
jgi:type II secretion system protein G